MADFNTIKFLENRPLLREITADRLNSILQEIKRNRPRGERGITVRQDGNSTYIGLATGLTKNNSTAQSAHPFQIFSSRDPESSEESPNYLVSVRPGTLNGVIATNWTEKHSCGKDELGYVVLTAQATSNSIVSTEISFDPTPPTSEQQPVKWGLPEELQVLIGLVRGQQVWQVVYDNLSFASAKRITTDREDPQIGELPYDNWYVWQKQ
jgi:hypothetical protein